MIKLRWVIAGVGALIVVAGLLFLSEMPVSATDATGHTVACGTATKPHGAPSADCAAAIKSRLHWTIPLTVVGMVVMIGGVFTQLQKNSDDRT